MTPQEHNYMTVGVKNNLHFHMELHALNDGVSLRELYNRVIAEFLEMERAAKTDVHMDTKHTEG